VAHGPQLMATGAQRDGQGGGLAGGILDQILASDVRAQGVGSMKSTRSSRSGSAGTVARSSRVKTWSYLAVPVESTSDGLSRPSIWHRSPQWDCDVARSVSVLPFHFAANSDGSMTGSVAAGGMCRADAA